MNKIFFFSKNTFVLSCSSENYSVNKFKNVVLTNVDNNSKITISQNCFGYLKCLECFPINVKSNNYFNVYFCNESKFINLISIDFENVVFETSTKNFNVKFLESAILLSSNKKCVSYCFNTTNKNYAIEINDELYIFNEFNLIKININTFISTTLITKKLEVNSNKYEVLCKIPQNDTYYILFSIDINKNKISIKKLKNNNDVNNNSLPYLIFYLCKLEFEEVSNYLSKTINYQDIKNYLNNFEDIIEIEDEFYIYSKSELQKISFSISNNIVNDID